MSASCVPNGATCCIIKDFPGAKLEGLWKGVNWVGKDLGEEDKGKGEEKHGDFVLGLETVE